LRNHSTTASRASNRSMPIRFWASGAVASSHPCRSLMDPSGAMTLITARPWRWPICQSSGSCAGVTFRKPVENLAFSSSLLGSGRTTCSSAMMGMTRPTIGSLTFLPTRTLARGSAGFMATAVSPSMVSGRVVATVTCSTFPPSRTTGSTRGYLMYQKKPAMV